MNTGLDELNDEQFRAIRFDVVSRLTDDLAHEIKNPLNAIVINLEVLRARVKRGDGGAALERADVIEQEARKLHLLIDRLLHLVRPETDDASPALDQVLDEILPLVEAQVRLARNSFRSDCVAAVLVAVPRVVLRFALLEAMSAVHERLGDGAGEFTVDCVAAEGAITVRVDSRLAADRDGPAPAPRLVHMAGALLRPFGGTVHADGTGITLVLPRTASV